MIIDKETKPHCSIIEKKFEWGEPYSVVTPIFDLTLTENTSILELSIEIYGNNNFKNQLLCLYNKLNNYKDVYLQNFEGIVENRDTLVGKLSQYIQLNLDISSPWEKYREYYDEIGMIKHIETLIDKKLVYVFIGTKDQL